MFITALHFRHVVSFEQGIDLTVVLAASTRLGHRCKAIEPGDKFHIS